MKPFRPHHGFTAYHREPGGLRRLDFFVDHLASWRGERAPADLRVLDIGCGNGNIAIPIASLGYRVLGVDGDATSIAQATAQAKDLGVSSAEFRRGWLDDIAGERFDAIIASEVLEHQVKTDAFLAALKKLLRPNGILLLSVPNGTSFEESLRWFSTHTVIGHFLKKLIKRGIGHASVQSHAEHPHQQFFSWHALGQCLDANGWEMEDVSQAAAIFKESFYLGGRLFLKRGTERFHRLDAADARLAARLPLPMADGWLIAARPFDASKPLIMHILPTLAGGGAERVVHDLCAHLPDEGFRVQTVSIIRGGPLEPLFRASRIPLLILGARGPGGLSAWGELAQLMRRRKPAIVHTHLFGADVMGRLAAMRAGMRRRVSTEHNVNRGHGLLKRLVKGLLAPFTSRFVAVSEEVKRAMVADEGIPANKITVIRNGIDLTRVVPRPAGPFGHPARLLFAGRLTEQKGLDVLLQALSKVHAPWFLQVAGSGERDVALRSLAERLGLAPRIRWMGQRDDIPQLLAESDVFCFPSRWEGLGLSLLEAAAAGVPIVASDLTVFREVIDPDEMELAMPGDAQDLARALDAVLVGHPDRALARAAALAPRIRETCSDKAMTKAYASLYRSLL